MHFIPDYPTLLAFLAASVVLAITPGPDMTLFVSRALSDGRAAGFACVAGAMSGITVHTLMVALGLSALVVASPTAFFALKAVGAAYLMWLAIQAIRKGSSLTLPVSGRSGRGVMANWAQGLGINLLNPKIILFFMTFLPQFVAASDPHITGKLIFLGMFFVVVSTPIVIAIVLGAHSLASWLKRKPQVMRIVDYVFASVFSIFALKIFLTQGR
ncbi:threonine/homoserine/homoserine lactone efflux protein [Hoeflea halophila]|uniref:Threonine/homoserine/homoserine lactone efflux protein n=1 Tax=Hoeflea halophila TaxID=714899 RepID=A0A286I9T1_9HYPH|nr:LysE family translocator [Hoeflea halophila]SOE16875.1 threonine/homoserine/homoserine lactone efflux protein [Hoeflea halophila]